MLTTVLSSLRLQLRPLSAVDQTAYLRWHGDPEIMAHIAPVLDQDAASRSFSAALAYNAEPALRRRFWVAQTRPEVAMGLLSLDARDIADSAELGAIIVPSAQRQGYAAEAILMLARYAFDELALQRLTTRHRPAHHAAAGLMRHLGFHALPPLSEGSDPASCRWELTRNHWARQAGSTLMLRNS